MIETIGSHLARRDSRKDRTQASRYAKRSEETLRNSSHFRFVEKGHRRGENVYSALGQTSAGRYLTVFYTQENGSSFTDIGTGYDIRREETICEKVRVQFQSRSYAKIGEFWDRQDLSNYWGKTRKVKFDVVLEPEATYYPIERGLSEKIQSEARKQGVSSDTLVNLWLEQKMKEQRSTRGGRRLSAKNA